MWVIFLRRCFLCRWSSYVVVLSNGDCRQSVRRLVFVNRSFSNSGLFKWVFYMGGSERVCQ